MIMNLIDREYTRHPFYGSPKLTQFLKEKGYEVNHKRVERLMQIMGIEAKTPHRNLSRPSKMHKKYPYLLTGMKIDRPNQVWCTDITYIPMKKGFMYLTAVMDWYSRYILSWEISNSADSDFCIVCLKRALRKGKPEIFNSDQGSQFTSEAFTSLLQSEKIRISMDGKGRAMDNIMIERFWRTLKYENIYYNSYETSLDLYSGLSGYTKFYNFSRYHSTLKLRPAQAYLDTKAS